MAKFKYLVSHDETLVYFKGYWGESTLGKNDKFLLRTGISIALFRAMKKRLLEGKKSKEDRQLVDIIVDDVSLFDEGVIEGWQEWAARYIAYMAYHRGEDEGKKLPAGTSMAFGTYGIMWLNVKPSAIQGYLLDAPHYMSHEESFIKTHKPSFSLAER